MLTRSPTQPRSAHPARVTPIRAFVLSVVALAVPVAATVYAPAWVEADGALLVWLPPLLPAFLLAYYRGWHGASLALAWGMVTLALSQAETLLLGVGPPPWPYLFGVVTLLVVVAAGAGWVAELLHRERAAAERAALTDPLTGLPNRRHALVFLEAAWSAASRGRRLAVVLFDLDYFKTVNDRHGHAEGDRVLEALGGVLRRRTRGMDLSARYGGEEFISVLGDCGPSQAVQFAEDVRAALAALDFRWGRVTLSAGVSAAEEAMGSPDVLLASADRALYAAKEGGRNRVVRADAIPPDAAGPSVGSTLPLPAPTSLSEASVLVVDDDALALRATERLLGRLGCTVRAAGSARQALDILAGPDPVVDVLVTDVVMPDMSGFTLVDQASRVRPGIPVLYISGYPREEVYWGGTPGVRSAFLAKPLDPDGLRSALTALLGLTGADISTARQGTGLAGAEPDGAVHATSPEEEAVGEQTPQRREGRILIVDDDPVLVRVLQRLFMRAGYREPLGLTDPRRVVDTLRDKDVDLLILDLFMPGMDGFEVMAAVSSVLGEKEYFPIVVLTGSDQPAVRRRALEAGAMDFLSKPFDPTEAEARVRNLLHARALTQRVSRQRDSLEEEVAQRTAELADSRAEILYRLALAAEYRDDMTGRHAERVGLLSSAIAQELDQSPRDVDLLWRTAPLHDVGKIGIPDAILLKAGRLTAAEFEVMKTHTTIGAQILGKSRHRLLEVARAIALHHHERWDGAGYPEGRRGAETPLEARIVAVADSFDTMTHARPYKAARPVAAALAEITRCGGSHYDPHVVDALLAITERIGAANLHHLAAPLDPLRDTLPARDPPRSA